MDSSTFGYCFQRELICLKARFFEQCIRHTAPRLQSERPVTVELLLDALSQVVRLVVVRTCKAAGLDAAQFGAHSLRSGFVTQSCLSGASDLSIRQQTRHKTLGMIARYRKPTGLFLDNAATKLGL